MDENTIATPFFNRAASSVKSLLRRIFPGKKEIRTESYSKFRLFLLDQDPKHPGYAQLESVVDLCEEGVRVAQQRVNLANKIQNIDERLKDLESVSKLTDADITFLTNMLNKFNSLTGERNELVYQLMSFDKSLASMNGLVEDAESAMPQIQHAEKNQRILKTDIGYLQGEKSDLEYEKESIENGMVFINRFTLAMLILFGIISFLIFYLYVFERASVFYPTTIFIIASIIVVSLLFFFRRRMRFELVLNVKKQNKAVELINKKNAVYAYYTRFLNYEYNKYKIRNSQMLKNNLHDYTHYKHISSRIDSIRKIMYETQSEIERFLKEKDIMSSNMSVEKFAQSINLADNKRYYNELCQERQLTERDLTILDERHESIWDSLTKYSEEDKSPDMLADKIIRVYIDEVTRVIQVV